MKRALSILLTVFLIASFLTPAKAQCPSEGNTVVLKAPAVSKTADGRLVGVATDFVITVAPGSGHVYVETWPLSEVDMQASARLAAQIAGKVTGKDMNKYDVFIQVRTESPIIGGPSAGGTMTVGIIAALMGWEVNPNVMMTGMINPDGTIGPVGGILEKAAAAASVGAKLFLIPKGQRIQVVQETQQKTIGGIIQVTSTGEKVDVVEYAKERWGLEVKEVSDIYEAVYYFTGKTLPRPKAPANVFIDTSFLKEDANRDYQNTSQYYEQVLEKLKKSNADYTTYTVLKDAMDQAKTLLEGAKEAIDAGKYYTALSRAFQARIVIRYVDWSLSVETPEDVANLLSKVSSYINQTESLVSSKEIKGMTMLQAVAAAEERIEDAKTNLQEGWKYYYTGEYWEAIDRAAYAYERTKTAEFWTELGERFAKGETINREELKDTARNYIDESSLIVTYIESMYGDVIGNDLTETIQEAEQYYGDGKYSAAIFTAMEARVRGEVFLDTLGIDNETILREKLQDMKEAAKTAIGVAQMNGFHPILSIAYYEFAESYEMENTVDAIVNAMIFYQYARESAGVFMVKMKEGVPTLPETGTKIPTLPTNTGKSSTTGGNSTTSSPEKNSVCGPAFIVALAILPLLRRRR